MDPFRRKMLLVPVAVVALTMLYIEATPHGASPSLSIAWAAFGALLLLIVGGLIVRVWFTRGMLATGIGGLLFQVALLLVLVASFDLSLARLR